MLPDGQRKTMDVAMNAIITSKNIFTHEKQGYLLEEAAHRTDAGRAPHPNRAPI